jgi:hypothetical protein
MKLRCIEKYFANFTYGKVYEVVGQTKSYIWVINDKGQEHQFDTIENYFEVVKEEIKVKKGDKVKCLYDRFPEHTINKIYEVLSVDKDGEFKITSDSGRECGVYFDAHHFEVVTDKAPSYYNNEKGSLYKFAEDHELNSYEFDLVKRLVRCRKKGNFVQDLEKTKFLIDLYLKEWNER